MQNLVGFWGCILMSVMQLELIYPKEAGVMLWLHELSVFDVEGFQPAFVDCLYCMLVQTTKLGHLLVGICAEGKQVANVRLQSGHDGHGHVQQERVNFIFESRIRDWSCRR